MLLHATNIRIWFASSRYKYFICRSPWWNCSPCMVVRYSNADGDGCWEVRSVKELGSKRPPLVDGFWPTDQCALEVSQTATGDPRRNSEPFVL